MENLILALPKIPALGFELGLQYSVATFGIWGFVMRISRNLRAGDAQLAALRQRAAEEEHIVRMGLLASGAALAGAATMTSFGAFAQTATTSFVGEIAGPERGPAVGLYVTCYYFGGSVGGVLPSVVWHWAGWNGVVGLLCAAGAIAAVIGWKSYRFPKDEAHPVTDPMPEIGGEA